MKAATTKRRGPCNLAGSLIGELAHEMPDNTGLESVRTDLLAAARSFERSRKNDLAFRLYLTIRALLREYEVLQDRLTKAEMPQFSTK
ncbi:MAG TPA: hypothetical protein VEN79_18305 [Terriglobia bacterium]|nr:hypothetical protein [Terriglobia bacterium]